MDLVVFSFPIERKSVREHRLNPVENIETAKEHASLLVQFGNVNVIKYLDLFLDKEKFIIVMEYLDVSKNN